MTEYSQPLEGNETHQREKEEESWCGVLFFMSASQTCHNCLHLLSSHLHSLSLSS